MWIEKPLVNLSRRLDPELFQSVILDLLFFKINFQKKSIRNTINVSNSLVGSDFGPNCFQRLSADNKGLH